MLAHHPKEMERKNSLLLCLQLLILCSTVVLTEEGRVEDVAARFPPLIPRKVRCRLRNFPTCFMVWRFCPPHCPQTCLMDCALCRTVCSCTRPGAVCQDPRFVGGDGVTFYFHGQKDHDFCLVTDNNLHINAHFIGKRNPVMKRDFTWVQSLGVLFDDHKLFVGAKNTSIWDDNSDSLDLSFDDELISLPLHERAKWQSKTASNVSVSRTRATNEVTMEVEGRFAISAAAVPIMEKDSRVHGYNITGGDCFAHLDLGFKFYDLSDNVDGVLGQTYRKNYTSRAKIGVAMPVLGGDHEFACSGLFNADCRASRFAGAAVKCCGGKEHPSVLCKNGASGHGVICKR